MSRRAWVAAAAGLIVVLGAAHRHQDPPDPAPVDTPDAVRVHTGGGHQWRSYSCAVDGTLTAVDPDTEQARAAAAQACADTNAAIDHAPWPSGLHQVPLPGDH